jgi:hypothetical protein
LAAAAAGPVVVREPVGVAAVAQQAAVEERRPALLAAVALADISLPVAERERDATSAAERLAPRRPALLPSQVRSA